MPRFRAATAMLPVQDMDTAVAFLSDCLGFKAVVNTPQHAYLSRDEAAIRLLPGPPDADYHDPNRQLVIYIDVDDADAVYFERKNALGALPKGRFRAPFDRPYGQREFHVIHGPFLFMVGHQISEDA